MAEKGLSAVFRGVFMDFYRMRFFQAIPKGLIRSGCDAVTMPGGYTKTSASAFGV